jgi:cysteinyl-tRNA synthetase
MDIKLENTLTGEKEVFKPIKAGEVSMYNCGPTVYNYAHIGNLRSYVFADILRRTFEYNGYKVNQVINITDIGHLSSDSDEGEDKMTKALKREGKPLTLEAMREVADFYFTEFKKDLKSLNIELPEHFPFASDNIKEDIELIEKLSNEDFTYKTSDGIYFDTSKFPEYGKLGNIKASDDEHSRIGINPEKRNSRDFAVWKFNPELGYDASFGKGFPGWHIECTAMSVKYLGPKFDIHTGGIDHIPVHHNNEIAQAAGAGYPYAQIWMHNAHLNMGEDKMAKSGENFITLNTLKEKGVDPLALRYVFLTAHYSSPLQFSWEALEASEKALKRLRQKINFTSERATGDKEKIKEILENNKKNFLKYVNDDLDLPYAIGFIHDIANGILPAKEKQELILEFDKVLGLELDKKESFEIPDDVKELISERDKARSEKDFTKSDELRGKIESSGFLVKDTPEGTVVSPK